jgi:hypothetical protein
VSDVIDLTDQLERIKQDPKYREQQEKQKSRDESISYVLNMKEAKGLVDFLMELATSPSYIPGSKVTERDETYFEGRRQLAMTLLQKAKIIGG